MGVFVILMIFINGGLGDLFWILFEMLVDFGIDCCGGGGVVFGILDCDNDEVLLVIFWIGGIGDGLFLFGWCWDWGWFCCFGVCV